jgi:hypothetical protein
MFISNFSKLSESLQIDHLDQLFKTISIDGLLQKDTLEHEVIIKTQPCYHFYAVNVDKDHVKLSIGTNSNNDYKGGAVSEDEDAENDSSICEHVFWWVLRFDGKKLHVESISGAG